MLDLTKLNHFEKFSLKPSPELDLDDLEDKYHELQIKYHPDTIYDKSNEEQDVAIANSIEVNLAYQILQNPLNRIIYLLKINGIDINDDNCRIKPDQEHLMEILDIRERFSFSDNVKEVEAIKSEVKRSIADLTAEIKDDFNRKDYDVMAIKTIKVKYLNKILEDIRIKQQ